MLLSVTHRFPDNIPMPDANSGSSRDAPFRNAHESGVDPPVTFLAHESRYPPNNLPLELSSFVGREKELAEVKRLLEDNRLLTLTGSGGAAKPG